MKYKILFAAFVALLAAGCYNEDALTPTTEPEPTYLLPQGDHDYDNEIVEWNRKCGFYILYRFQPQDIYWNLTAWDGITWSEANHNWDQSTFKALPAEEAYVGKQYQLLKNECLDFYPEATLQKLMPLKLLLCGVLWEPRGTDSIDMICRSGIDYIAINYGNSSVENMRSGQIDTLRSEINVAFLKKATDLEKITIPEEFSEGMVYDRLISENYDIEYEMGDSWWEMTEIAVATDSSMYARGFVRTYTTFEPTVKSDWVDYIQMIVSNKLSDLEATPDENDKDPDSWKTNRCVLDPYKDSKGLVRKKYDIVIKHFKEVYGVDLQSIGNKKQ